MILKASVSEAMRSLTSAKQRTLLALIGIVIGIGSVIGMVSIGNIVRNEALRQFMEMGVDIVSVQADPSEKAARKGFALNDILDLPATVSDFTVVTPYIESQNETWLSGKREHITWFGVTEAFFPLNNIRMKEGRFISDLDIRRYFCVVSSETAQKIGHPGESPIGTHIAYGTRVFTVVGVLESISQGAMRPYGLNEGVIVHITTALHAFSYPEIRNFLARVREKGNTVLLRKELEDYFAHREVGMRQRVRTAEELITSMQKQMQLFSILLGAVGSISLIVGGIGVMNVMLISVSERRREIGLRRALGAKRRDIQTQFLIESVALCLFGGIFGILLGVGVSYIFAHFSHWQFLVSGPAILLGFGVATTVGVFFGFYPARSAARLDPIKALRV